MTISDAEYQKRRELGWKIYEEKIKHLVEPQDHGKFLVLDVITGDYSVNLDLILAEDELKSRQPEGAFYIFRVGHRAPFRLPSIKIPRERS